MMCTRAIVLHGTEEQKQKYLEPISLGQIWTATCIAEKNAGQLDCLWHSGKQELDN